MSGGVDSSVAAARLLSEGYEVIGVTLHLWELNNGASEGRCCAAEDARGAQRVADQLGFRHYSLDRREQFARDIVEPFVDAYLEGRTPSPCVWCNELIKIPVLQRFARMIGATAVATGHYAQLVQTEHGTRLARGVDGRKDQSYFLSTLDASSLRMLRLPLGGDTKETVREEAVRRRLVVAGKGESQDLCFVPHGSYAQFVEERAVDRVRPGWVVDAHGNKLGRHAGIHQFTLGQRRGLGVATGKPVVVARIDADERLVVVADAGSARVAGVTIATPNVAVGVGFPVHVTLQVRYRDAGVGATLEKCEDGSIRASLDQPARSASPGQLAVAYVGNQVVAAGVIAQVAME